MKKFLTLFFTIICTVLTFAQAPESMSYQAVIRDASSLLLTDTSIGMQISILQGSESGTAVYVETQTPTTNANGLASIEIGTGTTSDNFSTIDWSNGPYFVKIETDPTGGTSYTIIGTSQLLSVPYALFAKDVPTGVFSTVGGVSNYNFVGGNVWTQFADLSTSITLAEDADVLISYNTANQHLSGQATYFLTRLTIDGVDIQGMKYLNSISGHQYSSNGASGIINLSAGIHTISVDYRTNTVDGNSFNNPSIEHMGRMLSVKELK